MDREIQQTFTSDAGTALASIRSSLLVLTQNGRMEDLSPSRRCLSDLRELARSESKFDVAEMISDCISALDNISTGKTNSPGELNDVLDGVARIEAGLLDVPVHSDEFVDDLNALVDSSFEDLIFSANRTVQLNDSPEEFEIDEETLDIFRGEADELLAGMLDNLAILSTSPSDKSSLWEIRRCAHTFKGAAGIVGYKEACQIAHQMEDLLDRVVESARGSAPSVIIFLQTAIETLDDLVSSKVPDGVSNRLELQFDLAMQWLSESAETRPVQEIGLSRAADQIAEAIPRPDLPKVTATPVVRVSLDRLDDLVKLSRSLMINRAALAERFSMFAEGVDSDKEARSSIQSLFEIAHNLTAEMQQGLLQIRMVKFGTLETRLSRAVHSTCDDEGKKAAITIENGEVEIDTQVIDALIEPLLHLLKNAVVHGIEPPETRRLIGKPERGSIRIGIEADGEALVLTVSDDGGGISLANLLNKAVANGILQEADVSGLDEKAATQLIFTPGLTTTDKIDLNAGRGIGMAIVKESVERRGGTVLVKSQLQTGTTFTIMMPMTEMRPTLSKTSAKPEPHPQPSDEPLVLIVDDSATIRNQTIKIVENAGLRAISANNGAEALDLLLSGRWEPDLILSDVEMPQLDGWQFLEYVKTDANFGEIPVVMITSLDPDTHRGRALELGASDYLIKPIEKEKIERVLDEYCSRPTD